MAAQAESQSKSSPLDTAKLTIAFVIFMAGVVAYHHFVDQSLLYRVLGVLGASIVAALLGLTTAQGRTLREYVYESRIELARVIWPTGRETMQATMVVVAMVFVVGIFLWLLDMFLFWGVQLLTGQGG